MDFWTRCFLPKTVHDVVDTWGPIAFICAALGVQVSGFKQVPMPVTVVQCKSVVSTWKIRVLDRLPIRGLPMYWVASLRSRCDAVDQLA